MIELTEQQMQALENLAVTPPRVVNPRTKETFVLLRVDDYEQMKEEEYDDSPWTREELQALAWERVKRSGGDPPQDLFDGNRQPLYKPEVSSPVKSRFSIFCGNKG